MCLSEVAAVAATCAPAIGSKGSTMLKSIGAAQRHPTNRTLEDFGTYWSQAHGPMGANMSSLRRYVQHITLPEAYGIDPAPTFDGVSMFWSDGIGAFVAPSGDPKEVEMMRVTRADDQQLFDRSGGWPANSKRAGVTAEEHVILDGETTPEMVKAVFIVSKLSGLTLNEFFDHWEHYHASLVTAIPGVRRYVQNHGVLAAYEAGTMTHDGFSEVWFDDLASLHHAAKTPEWRSAKTDGATIFDPNIGVVVCHERVKKEFDWTYSDWGVGALDEDAIRARLRADGYTTLAEDPDAPGKIKKAAANEALVIWNELHLVTIDESQIDERPAR
jgi:uncharacterized protein (TIGR02118 family)